MKKALLNFIALSLLGLFTKVSAQSCLISDVVISNTKVVGGTDAGACRATFNASFTIANKVENRFIFIQTY
ncbi:MAG TPA: hypothetical protein VD794_02790, partial [Flavisolibacter sp.]|nr:hypothetical protein [Flavisolibacter sp.]